MRESRCVDSTVPLSDSFVEVLRRARPVPSCVTLLVAHRGGVERVALRAGWSVVVGRAAPSQIRVDDDSLSREHARFTLADGAITVEDLHSTNGTWVGGVRAARAELAPGDEVILGDVMVSVCTLSLDEGASAELLSHERLRLILEDEVVRARYFVRRFAVVMVRPAPGERAPAARFFRRLAPLLRPVDRVATYTPDTLAILLPETHAEGALELTRAICASAAEGGPTLVAGVATFPDAATMAEELLELCWNAVRGATVEEPVRAAKSRACGWSDAMGHSDAKDDPIAASDGIRRVFATVARLVSAPIPVLLLGETGVGKEVIARAIHERGPRSARPFVCVNCGAIARELVESTLFGHERGAFTGASQQQRGVFEVADGGTVLLDEIGELTAAAQAVLLRVLETKRVTRLGSSREIEVDVRVLAATHRDLEAMCDAGGFRLDLLYRLNAMTLTIPPLRERPEDIAPLALRFLHRANQGSGLAVRGIEPEALQLLRGYSWPGNVRELRNAMERAVVVAEGDRITAQDLPERLRVARPLHPPSCAPGNIERRAAQEGAESLQARVSRYEAEIIVEALRAAGWNQTETARMLGMPLRTLVHKIKVLGIKKLGYATP